MASTLEVLSYSALATLIDERKKPNMFLMRLLFGSVQTLHTETIELSVITRARKVAPFVRKNGAAIMSSSYGRSLQVIEAPNIRIKRPFTPSELLFGRQPGNSIFPSTDEQISGLEQHVARDMAGMDDDIVNAEEWLAAQIVGPAQVTIEDGENEVWQITAPKPAGNTVVLAGDDVWDNPDKTLPKPRKDFQLAKRTLNQEVGLNPTDAIMDEVASEAFQALAEVGQILDQRHVTPGMIDFTTMFNEDGAQFLGTFCGIRCWEYSRSVEFEGADTTLIREGYVEFVCATPAAQHLTYYGAIADVKALEGRNWIGRRFGKSWQVEDPSAWMALAASRPMPWSRRPGANFSLDTGARA